MEGQLIGEIERRPVLYDRSVQACKKMSARDEAWREVADIMKQTEAEVKKRWRTLRDSFMRYHRLQRTFGPKGKKKTWIYYAEMAFLIPHIEPRDYKQMSAGGFDGNEYNIMMEDAMDQSSQQEPGGGHQFADIVSIASDMCKAELTTTTPPSSSCLPAVSGGAGSPPTGGGCPCFNGVGVHQHREQQQQATVATTMMEPVASKRRRRWQQQQRFVRRRRPWRRVRRRRSATDNDDDGNGGGGGGDDDDGDDDDDDGYYYDYDDDSSDSDEHFALSCVAALRRLPVRKNAEMRVRILHMLYEAEYGEEPAYR